LQIKLISDKENYLYISHYFDDDTIGN